MASSGIKVVTDPRAISEQTEMQEITVRRSLAAMNHIATESKRDMREQAERVVAIMDCFMERLPELGESFDCTALCNQTQAQLDQLAAEIKETGQAIMQKAIRLRNDSNQYKDMGIEERHKKLKTAHGKFGIAKLEKREEASQSGVVKPSGEVAIQLSPDSYAGDKAAQSCSLDRDNTPVGNQLGNPPGNQLWPEEDYKTQAITTGNKGLTPKASPAVLQSGSGSGSTTVAPAKAPPPMAESTQPTTQPAIQDRPNSISKRAKTPAPVRGRSVDLSESEEQRSRSVSDESRISAISGNPDAASRRGRKGSGSDDSDYNHHDKIRKRDHLRRQDFSERSESRSRHSRSPLPRSRDSSSTGINSASQWVDKGLTNKAEQSIGNPKAPNTLVSGSEVQARERARGSSPDQSAGGAFLSRGRSEQKGSKIPRDPSARSEGGQSVGGRSVGGQSVQSSRSNAAPSEDGAGPIYTHRKKSGVEHRGHQDRVADREAARDLRGYGLRSEEDERAIQESLMIHGCCGPSEEANWRLINYLSGGGLENGEITWGNCARNSETKRLSGAVFIRCRDPQTAERIAYELHGQQSWKGRSLGIRDCPFGVIPSAQSTIAKAPMGSTRPAHMLMNIAQDITEFDLSGEIWNLGCSWCFGRHQVNMCPSLSERLRIDQQDYECSRCRAINRHRTCDCPHPVDYGIGRGDRDSLAAAGWF